MAFGHTAFAQLPSVSGTVFQDQNLDGLFNPGEAIVGVSVDLFQDDGDGLFSPTVDSLVSSGVTDANGLYYFGGLDITGDYFVRQSAQTVGGVSLPASLSGLLGPNEFLMLIDDFADQQEVTANPIVGVGATNLTSSTVIGGQRDLHIEYISGPAESTLYANPFGLNEVLEFNQSAAVISVATITWDGIDGDMSTTPQAGGLGGIDITNGGLNEAFAFDLGIDAAGAGENLTLRIFSDGGVSEAIVSIPVTNGTAMSQQTVALSEFIGTADLTAVDVIQLEIGGSKPSIDAQIGPIGLIGSAVNDISVPTPEPSSMLLAVFGFAWFLGKNRRRRTR